MSVTATQQWLELVTEAMRSGTLVKLSLGAPRPADAPWRRIRLRPVELRAGPRIQCVWEGSTQDLTKNLEPDEALARLAEWLGTSFGSAHALTTTCEAQLELPVGKPPRMITAAVQVAPPDRAHDRVKERRVDRRQPWLQALRVTTASGSVCHGMEAKFRQIHRFIELLDPLLADAGLTGETASPRPEPLRIVDMGCGKGYLTFAVHEHLRSLTRRPVETRGIELRPELVDNARRVALETECLGLEFSAGAIVDTVVERADALIALHACDTATDDALAAGIAAGAALLVVAPCCQKELRPQLNPPPGCEGVWRHGIFRERQTEFVTDAMRALLLEVAGYEPKVFEFISPEHTAKNVMVAAVKRAVPEAAETTLRRVRDLAASYGVMHHRLADRLHVSLGSNPT